MALDFSQTGGGAATDYLDFGDTTILDGLTALSAGGWFWLDTTPAGGVNCSVIRKDGTATPVQLNGTDGKWNAVLWSGGLKVFNGPTFAAIGTGAWVHLMCTWTIADGDVRFYINGTLNTTAVGAATSGLSNVANVLRFGATESAGEAYDGKMAEIAFWNRELAAAEVASLALGFCPLFAPRGLILYTPLVRPVTNVVGASPTATGTDVIDHPRVIYPGRAQSSYKPTPPAGGADQEPALIGGKLTQSLLLKHLVR